MIPRRQLATRLLACTDPSSKTVRLIQGPILSIPHFILGPPTQAKAHQKLLHEEYVREMAGLGCVGEAATLSRGISLERDQYVYQFDE